MGSPEMEGLGKMYSKFSFDMTGMWLGQYRHVGWNWDKFSFTGVNRLNEGNLLNGVVLQKQTSDV